jgi:hypothetical protein
LVSLAVKKKKASYTPFIINASIEGPSNCIYGFMQLISGQRITSRDPQLPTDRAAIFEEYQAQFDNLAMKMQSWRPFAHGQNNIYRLE